MRCRKARSCLSAYCNGELTGRRHLAVREHLSTCSGCRREEAIYLSMCDARADMPQLGVSSDFNVRLLNRIGQERFRETKTKAFFPNRIPVVRWGTLLPVVSTAALVLVFLAYWPGMSHQEQPSASFATGGPGAAAWLTAEPTDNPNMMRPLHKDWSLEKQLRTVDRMARLSNVMTAGSGFGQTHLAGASVSGSGRPLARVPVIIRYHRMRPVIKVYQPSVTKSDAEDEELF